MQNDPLVSPNDWEVSRTEAHARIQELLRDGSVEQAAADLQANIDAGARIAFGGIGDVHSNTRGSGARYNANKTPYRYVPARVLADWVAVRFEMYPEAELLGVLAEFEARRVGARLLLLHLPQEYMEAAAHVFHYGAQKYAAWNWAKGMPWSVPMECAKRHILAGLDAQDDESGYSHGGHVACNFIMLAHYERCYPEGDDRPPAGIFQVAQGSPT